MNWRTLFDFLLRLFARHAAWSPQQVKQEAILLFAWHGSGRYDIRPCAENILHHHIQHVDGGLQPNASQLPHYARE